MIEERTAKELLNTHGGLGERIAAPGISVWNPAFDVTPAELIAGIITEKVCVSKDYTCFKVCMQEVGHIIKNVCAGGHNKE